MIHKLTLTGFGKFRKAEFELSGVTLVYGPNEAGKTTFFDGLFQALCRPSETKKAGKVLKARYGSGRSAQAVLSNDVPITDEEFMNLYAIREGDLRLELDKGTEWLDQLKSRLFHGGVDPSVLASEFEKRSSDSRTHLHNKELEKAREAAVKARAELDGKRREREALLARERSLADAGKELVTLRASILAAEAESAGLEKQLAAEERIALRQKWNGHLAKVEEWQALEAAAKSMSSFSEDRRAEFERLQEASRNADAAIQAERGKREQQTLLATQAKADVRTLRDAKDAGAPRSLAAQRLFEAAKAASAGNPASARLPGWSLAVAVLLPVAGGAGAWMLGAIAGALSGAVFAVAALLGSILVLFAGMRTRKVREREAAIRNLARWKDEWNLAASEAGKPAGAEKVEMSTLEGFLQAMEVASKEKSVLEAKELEAARRLENLQDGLAALETSLAALREDLDASRRAEREWLSRHGVESLEEYLLKVARCRQIRTDLPKRRSELEALTQGTEPESFHREARRKLHGLDEDGVPEKGLDDAALQRLRKQRQDLTLKKEADGRREAELNAKREGMAGEIRGAFGKLAGEIVECEDRLTAAEEEIRGKELDKQAAALALGIFKEIGDGADMLLTGLSREMERMLARVLPADRTVSLLGLESGQIQVKDAGGGVRALDHLSTGTRHAMVLAAKLALALKHRQGPGILVLDEPFLAMDGERETKALELLREFHSQYGWQIILMTKETGLKNKVQAVFSDPKILDLSLFH